MDFGIWAFEPEPESATEIIEPKPEPAKEIRKKLLSFMIERIKRVAPKTVWVPLDEYLKEEIIYDKTKGLNERNL